MKKILTVLSILLIISIVFNIISVYEKTKISGRISDSIEVNVLQLADLYVNMYSDGEPNEYFEVSVVNGIGICDKLEEEFVFYKTIYPKRVLFLEYLTEDYKLLMRTMKNNPDTIKEGTLLHSKLQEYILSYVDLENHSSKELYKTDKLIKEQDNQNWHLLHDEIVKLSK